MSEDTLVAETARQLGRSVEEYVSGIAAAARPKIGDAFRKDLVEETSNHLAAVIDAFVALVVAESRRAPSEVDEGLRAMVVRLAIAPGAVADVMTRTTARYGLSEREADVLTAALCGIPRSRLASLLGLADAAVGNALRHALAKTGHETLDDAIWDLRERAREVHERVRKIAPLSL